MAEAPAAAMGPLDHSRDEQEFNLKASIAGWESILEDQKASGADTSFAESHLASLKEALNSL